MKTTKTTKLVYNFQSMGLLKFHAARKILLLLDLISDVEQSIVYTVLAMQTIN